MSSQLAGGASVVCAAVGVACVSCFGFACEFRRGGGAVLAWLLTDTCFARFAAGSACATCVVCARGWVLVGVGCACLSCCGSMCLLRDGLVSVETLSASISVLLWAICLSFLPFGACARGKSTSSSACFCRTRSAISSRTRPMTCCLFSSATFVRVAARRRMALCATLRGNRCPWQL